MKKVYNVLLASITCIAFWSYSSAQGGSVPEILYYQFDGAGTIVTNMASAPPAGTATGTLMGGMTLGGTGLCGGALIGTGGPSGSDYVNTGWNTNLGTGAWTIAMWTDNIPSSSTLFYNFGDNTAGSLRCFTNGVAGSGNFQLRGPLTDVLCNGCAPIGVPSMTVFVYDPTLGNIKAYHDGVLNNTVAQGALNINGTAPFKVGGYSTSTGMASGQLMDEFRIYDRALDAQEVFDTYNACLPLTSSLDDAGVASIDGPVNFCAGTDSVVATIRNYGISQIDSCIVQWEIDGVAQTPYNYYGLLDTNGGSGLTTAQLTLGSATFAAGITYNITAWTELPNGVVDTVLINDTSSVNVQSSLTGLFTIGGITPDYSDFTTAVSDLNTYGICGPVTFDVRSATYNEQIDLGSIGGTSSTNTIVFRSQDGNRDSVILTFPSTLAASNYTVRFSGADHISFEQMTIEATGSLYGHAMEFAGASDSNTVWDSGIVGYNGNTTSTNNTVIYSNTGDDNGNSFIGNTIENGSYGVYWYGTSITSLEEGTVFQNNDFLNQYYSVARLSYQDAPKINNNTIATNSPYTGTFYGLYTVYCDNAMEMTNNNVVLGSDHYGYGIYLSNNDGTASERSLIANNMVSVGDSSTTSTSYGIYSTNNGYCNIYNNSVNVASNGTNSRAIYATTGGECSLMNNSFVNEGPGYAGYFTSIYTISSSDYNNYYSGGSTNFIYYGASNQTDLSTYQTTSGFDANSISVNPNYFSYEDLHSCGDSLSGLGTPLASISTDIDGMPRDASNPDIGADEFSLLSSDFLGADLEICTGDSLTLWAGSPTDNILWSTGDTTHALVVNAPGTYTATVTGACGLGVDTVVVTTSALVYAGYLQADTTFFCTPGSAALSSSQPATSYVWSTTETSPTITVTTGGTYTLDITDGCGTGSESITVIEAAAPTASFTGTNSFVTYTFTNTSTGAGTLSYSWDFGDGNTSTDTDPVHIYSAVGTYLVTLTVTNECGTSVISDSITTSSVSLDEIGNGNALAIYPNPNEGVFTLDMTLTQVSNVEVFVTNELGQIIFSNTMGEKAGSHLETINLGKVQPGLYFITLGVDDDQFHSKFIVK